MQYLSADPHSPISTLSDSAQLVQGFGLVDIMNQSEHIFRSLFLRVCMCVSPGP